MKEPRGRDIVACVTRVLLASSCLLVVLLSGCVTKQPDAAPAVSPTIIIDSIPTDAKVFYDGILIGVTPTRIPVLSDKVYVVTIEKEGYRNWNCWLGFSDQTWRVSSNGKTLKIKSGFQLDLATGKPQPFVGE